MPISKKYDYDALIYSIKKYIDKTKRRVSFEYTMMDGLNDTPECAYELASKLRGMLCHVNLIPVNPARGTVNPSAIKKITAFCDILTKKGINTTIRRTLGRDIDAACGQLRAKNKRGE